MKNILLFLGLLSFYFRFFINKKFLIQLNLVVLKASKKIAIKIFFDFFSLMFFGILMIIVFRVNIFSNFYLRRDKNFNRFYWILMFFVFSMGLLIFFPKFIFLLVGWDGLGVTRFILIIYYNTHHSWLCGLKTYLINRLGDGLLICWVMKLFNFGYWELCYLGDFECTLICIVLMLGLFTKSAQFPFCSWLPAAMAAPTPVSALVHSSTLVTAGIFVLFRVSSVFTSFTLNFIGIIGLFTLLIASFSACGEWDFKKIIAFSTLSQLGLMCFSLSLGLNNLCFFHLISHAVFKALFFICSGILLGQFNHFQDLRKLSSLKKFKPLVDFVLLVSILRLCGFPFLSGFFSKDIIIEKKKFLIKIPFSIFLILSLPLTVFYSFRIIFFLWGRGKKKSKNFNQYLEETNLFRVGLLFLLSCFLRKIFEIKEKKKNFLSFYLKLALVVILLSGFLLCNYSTKIFIKNWSVNTIFFCESKKTTKVSKNFSNLGRILFFFEQRLKFWLNNTIVIYLLKKRFKILKNSLKSIKYFPVIRFFFCILLFLF